MLSCLGSWRPNEDGSRTMNLATCRLLSQRQDTLLSALLDIAHTPCQNTLHVGAASSDFAIRFFHKPDQPRFNALNSIAVKRKS